MNILLKNRYFLKQKITDKFCIFLLFIFIFKFNIANANSIHLGMKINYNTAMSHVEKDDLKTVDILYSFSQKFPNANLLISGHTDTVGSYKINVELSKSRAEILKRLLVQRGMPRNRIETKWFSYNAPIASNKTSIGRRKNRRSVATFLNLSIEQSNELALLAKSSDHLYVIESENKKVEKHVKNIFRVNSKINNDKSDPNPIKAMEDTSLNKVSTREAASLFQGTTDDESSTYQIANDEDLFLDQIPTDKGTILNKTTINAEPSQYQITTDEDAFLNKIKRTEESSLNQITKDNDAALNNTSTNEETKVANNENIKKPKKEKTEERKPANNTTNSNDIKFKKNKVFNKIKKTSENNRYYVSSSLLNNVLTSTRQNFKAIWITDLNYSLSAGYQYKFNKKLWLGLTGSYTFQKYIPENNIIYNWDNKTPNLVKLAFVSDYNLNPKWSFGFDLNYNDENLISTSGLNIFLNKVSMYGFTGRSAYKFYDNERASSRLKLSVENLIFGNGDLEPKGSLGLHIGIDYVFKKILKEQDLFFGLNYGLRNFQTIQNNQHEEYIGLEIQLRNKKYF
jgi:hypothetical protein